MKWVYSCQNHPENFKFHHHSTSNQHVPPIFPWPQAYSSQIFLNSGTYLSYIPQAMSTILPSIFQPYSTSQEHIPAIIHVHIPAIFHKSWSIIQECIPAINQQVMRKFQPYFTSHDTQARSIFQLYSTSLEHIPAIIYKSWGNSSHISQAMIHK